MIVKPIPYHMLPLFRIHQFYFLVLVHLHFSLNRRDYKRKTRLCPIRVKLYRPVKDHLRWLVTFPQPSSDESIGQNLQRIVIPCTKFKIINGVSDNISYVCVNRSHAEEELQPVIQPLQVNALILAAVNSGFVNFKMKSKISILLNPEQKNRYITNAWRKYGPPCRVPVFPGIYVFGRSFSYKNEVTVYYGIFFRNFIHREAKFGKIIEVFASDHIYAL